MKAKMKRVGKSTDESNDFQASLEAQIEKLRQSHRKLSATLACFTQLYESSPIGHLILGEQSTVTELNPTLEEMLGIRRSEILGISFTSLIIRDDRQKFLEYQEKNQGERSLGTCDLRLKNATGDILFVRLDFLVPLPSGKQPAWEIAMRNIGKFKELEGKLDDEMRLRQNILDALPGMAILLRPDTHRIVALNKAAADRGVVPGSPCYHFWKQRNMPCPWCRMPAVAESGRAKSLQLWDMDIHREHYWTPVTDELYLHCAFDITNCEMDIEALQHSIDELKNQVERQAEELERARKRLLNSEKIAAIGRVSATIIQDFNDPLQAISNVLGGIHRRGTLDSEDMPLVDLAYREAKKLNNLARDLREFYQPIHGKTDLLDMRVELAQVIDSNRSRLSDKGIIITLEFIEEIPLIHAVAGQIKKMFQELLDNIIVFCGRDDTIRITMYVENDVLVLQVDDGGCGICRSVIAPLFEPLSNFKSRKSTEGLGLATSYAIITMHGGTIETEADHGNSSVFKIKLPIQTAAIKDSDDAN